MTEHARMLSLTYETTHPIKTKPTIFQGLSPSEMAHTVSGVCFSLNKSTS